MATMTCWQDPLESLPQLVPGQLHLWRFSLNAQPETYRTHQSYLSSDELARADRLLDPQKQHDFTVGRSCLRQLLSNYLDLPPQKINFSYNSSGKPFIAGKNSGQLAFNLSHSGSRAILAVTIAAEIGVDIEMVDPDLNFQSSASRYFTPVEIGELQDVATHRQRRQFYRIWTRKEAVLKMIGSGFSSPHPGKDLLQNCWLNNMFVAGNTVSAVAINRNINSVFKYNFVQVARLGRGETVIFSD